MDSYKYHVFSYLAVWFSILLKLHEIVKLNMGTRFRLVLSTVDKHDEQKFVGHIHNQTLPILQMLGYSKGRSH